MSKSEIVRQLKKLKIEFLYTAKIMNGNFRALQFNNPQLVERSERKPIRSCQMSLARPYRFLFVVIRAIRGPRLAPPNGSKGKD